MNFRTVRGNRPVLTILSALIAIAIPANVRAEGTAPNKDRLKKQPQAHYSDKSGQISRDRMNDLQAQGTTPGQDRTSKPRLYDRETPFWTLSTGPDYGFRAETGELPTGDIIHLMVGDLDTRTGGFSLPPELTNADVAPAPGHYSYYLIQIRPSLTSTDADSARTLQAIREMGVRLEDYAPGGGWIARVDRDSLQSLRSSSLLQFIQPYHAAYKLDPFIGRLPHPDAVKAASDDYTLSIRFFGGQRDAVAVAMQALGVEIIPDQASDASWLLVNTKAARIFDIARIEGVASVYEYVHPISYSEESQLLVLNGFYTVNTTSTFYVAGVDGSGQRLFDNIGGAVDINGNGIVDAGAQIVSMTDTGLSTDAGDFSETRVTNGVLSQTANTINFVPNARKMKGYVSASATGSGGTGDLFSCDGAAEGAFTHGQTTSACAAGNATDVPTTGSLTTPAFDWDGDGTIESYGTKFNFISGTSQIRVDGVAKGARLFFVDSVGIGGCPESSGTGLNPGNLQTVLNFAHTNGARLHNFSFGVNSTTPTYSAGAAQIDDFLRLNKQDMLFISAGNSGDDTSDADNFGTPATLGLEAQNKNGVVVGACFHNIRLARVGFSSIGPAGTAAVRIKPDIMAPGSDFGGAGLLADYNCRDDDSSNIGTIDIDCLQNIGHSGTSYSSPNAMGAGAIARDYFATGNYPDGTVTNATNSADRANIVSGALVKALLIASADSMPGNQFGSNNIRYAYRYNSETGYGSIDLSNVLPLVNDPNTPLGLIVHDVGDAATPSKVRSLSLPSSISNNVSNVDTFKVIDKTQVLRIALAWVDDNGLASGSALANNLSLEVVDPGVDGVAGNNDDIHYYGNTFTEDFNDDGTIDLNCDIAADGTPNESCDFDHDGSNDKSAWSRGICKACGDSDGDGTSNNSTTLQTFGLCDANGDGTLTTATQCLTKPNDNANTTEVVMLSPDPANNGQGPGNDADNQLRIGTWRIIVGHPVPTGGTHTAQSYAVVIAGGVSLQSSVRLDTNPLKCNGDISVSVTELAEAGDTGCNTVSCPAATVQGRTRVEVRNAKYLTDGLDNDSDGSIDEALDRDANSDGTNDSGEDLVDLERGGLGISLIAQGTGLGFGSDVRIPASSSPTLRYMYNDGILSVDDAVVLVGVYDDKLGAVTNTRKSTSTVDCVAQIDLFAIGQVGRNVPFLMTGGCDSDKFFDEGEAFSYQVQLGNLDGQTLKDAKVVLRARTPIELDGCDNDKDGTVDENDGTEAAADPCRTVCAIGSPIPSCNKSCDFTKLTIHTPANVGGLVDGAGAGTDAPGSLTPVIIGEFQQDFLKDVAFAVEVEPGVTFPEQVEMVVGLTAIPSGRTVESCQVFRHLVDADLDKREYSTDFPTGGTTDRDINKDEAISNPINDPQNPFPNGNQRDNYDKLNETLVFDDMTTTAFGGGNPGFAGPWDFDSDLANHQGFRSGIYGGSVNQGTEITNWGEDQNFNNILDGTAKCDNPSNAVSCTCPGNIFPCVNTLSTPNCGTNATYFACTGPGNGCFCRTTEDIEGDNDGVMDENHNLLGGCGFASRNGTSRGAWHSGTIAAIGLATCADGGTLPPAAPTASCEFLDTEANSLGANLWFEFLATPIMSKVHIRQDGALSTNGKDDDADGACLGGTSPGLTCLVNTDCAGTGAVCDRIDEDDNNDGTLDEGFAYRVELTDWRWNLNADEEAGNSWLTWEPDMDTTTLDPVDISDGFLFNNNDQGMGPLSGGNPNLTRGFPMFVNNDFGDTTGTAGQRNGVSDQNGDGTIDGDVNHDGIPDGVGNRFSDRSCFFQTVPAANLGQNFPLRDPEPQDDDCDSDIVSYGADGAPGVRGFDDDGDAVIDNPSEACPCFNVADSQDDDADLRIDEIDELQRFWRCKLTPFQACRTNTTCTGVGNVCNQFGAPVAYGDDVCGDGKIDENVSGVFAGRDVDGDGTLNDVVLLSENGNRLQQNGNWNLSTINGPFLRFGTVEDFYGVESGTSFQGAIGQGEFEGSGVTALSNTYGMAMDDMVWEWREEHPINQAVNNNCAVGTAPPPGGGAAGAGGAGQGGGVALGTAPQCASVGLASDLIFEASTTIPAQVVDVNANAALCTGITTLTANCTQGTINCNKYGLGLPGVYSNDCDLDGLFELEISATNLEEPEGETIRLEQDAASSPVYVGNISVSSTLNALNDGVIFVQWRGIIFPSVTARYFDKSDGVTGFDLGADGRPGIPNVDDDGDSRGGDKKPGIADLDDDGTGQCSTNSGNPGAICNSNVNCTESGTCTLIDDAHEACRDTNSDGTVNNTDIHFGDDDCSLVDEADELCPNGGVKPLFSDDHCGCALNPREATVVSSFQDGDALWAYYTIDDNSDGTTSGDGDGLVDDRELIRMDVTVRNMSTSLVMQDVEAVLSSRDTEIACITDATASLGTIASLAFRSASQQNDRFELIVGDVSRTTMLQDKAATFSLAVTGTLVDTAGVKTPFFGTTNPQQQSMDLDLDASVANSNALIATDKKTIIFNLSQHCVGGPTPGIACTSAATCGTGGTCPAGSSQCTAGKECYTFTGSQTGAWQNFWVASAFPNRPGLHCQYTNPGNPNVGEEAPKNCFLTQDTGVLNLDNNLDGTRDAGDSDWYLHTQLTRANTQRGHTTSQGSTDLNEGTMHMGFERRICTGTAFLNCGATIIPYNVTTGADWTTYHLDNIMQVYYKTTFKLGLGRGQNYSGTNDEDAPTLSFWHQMHLADDDMFGLTPPESFDGAVVHVLVDRDNDGTPEPGSPSNAAKDGYWTKIKPYFGVPVQQPQPFLNCRFDPDDDGNTENDIFVGETIFGPSSTCFPEVVWGCVGDTQDQPFRPNFGQAITGSECFTEGATKANVGGLDENGDGSVNGRDTGIASCALTSGVANCAGAGGWMETKFDLMQFRGRAVFIRFLTSSGQFGLTNWLDAFAPSGTTTFTGNRDDGWYIDDMVVAGLQTGTPYVLKPDIDAPVVNTCPTDNCPVNPVPDLRVGTYPIQTNLIDDDLDGTIDEVDETKTGNNPGVDDNLDGTIDNPAEDTPTDAPLRVVSLDASKTTVLSCTSGQLQYEFLSDVGFDGTTDKVLTGFSTSSIVTDNPECDTLYTVNVRCSSDLLLIPPPCSATDRAYVLVPGTPQNLAGHIVVTQSGATTKVSWPAQGPGTLFDLVRGNLQTLASGAGNFTTALTAITPSTDRCMANNTALLFVNDAKANPAANQGYFYIVRPVPLCGGNGYYNSTGVTQVGLRDAEINAAAGSCAP